MSSKEDLKTHALSTIDFYALLSLSPTFTDEKDLQRAWRKTALIHHPDKAGADNAAAAESFHQASVAFQILGDAELRSIYDNARTAREQRAKRDAVLEGDRRKLKEELEGRERRFAGVGTKRRFRDAELGLETEEEKREREVRRLAEDGRKRRLEMEERLRNERDAERKEAEERAEATRKPARPVVLPESASNGASSASSPSDGTGMSGQTSGSKGKTLFELTMERLKHAEARKKKAQKEAQEAQVG